MSEMTKGEVGTALATFSNYRVLRTQQIAQKFFNFPHASTTMSLGLRETGLKNICGGAIWVDEHWVQAFSDRGCFQIAESESKDWLESVPGCPEGQWGPKEGHNALEPHYCPRFTDAAEYVYREFASHRSQAKRLGVPDSEVERFCVAAHNAGFQGALNGWREGDVDKHSAHGDYSKWVMKYAGMVHDWVVAHPNWIYHGQKFGSVEPIEE